MLRREALPRLIKRCLSSQILVLSFPAAVEKR